MAYFERGRGREVKREDPHSAAWSRAELGLWYESAFTYAARSRRVEGKWGEKRCQYVVLPVDWVGGVHRRTGFPDDDGGE
jgi:hypothetical protein